MSIQSRQNKNDSIKSALEELVKYHENDLRIDEAKINNLTEILGSKNKFILGTYSFIKNFNYYNPKKIGNYCVHNKNIANLIVEVIKNPENFKNLYSESTKNGVFSYCSKYGLIETSAVSLTENSNMSENKWITDIIHSLYLLENLDERKISIGTIAEFYCSKIEQKAFNRIIKKPSLYRNLNDTKEGVAHIFRIIIKDGNIRTQRDPEWNNNKRLESHGLALKTLCDYILKFDVKIDKKNDIENICKAITSLTLYFIAIDYPTAPSVGCWEEILFADGLTWDTEAIRQGFLSLRELMFLNTNKSTHVYRQKIISNAVQYERELNKNNLKKIFESIDEINKWIKAGENLVRKRLTLQTPVESSIRGCDSTLSFVPQYNFKFINSGDVNRDIIKSAAKYLHVLKCLEKKLVRENGMIRYEPFYQKQDGNSKNTLLSCINYSIFKASNYLPYKYWPNIFRNFIFFDSYLSVNYWVSLDEKGYFDPSKAKQIEEFASTDTSNIDKFLQRNKSGIPGKEAEWFLVSEMALAYINQADQLKTVINRPEATEYHEQAISLFVEYKSKAIEYVLRSYARITPKIEELDESDIEAIKSNGEYCDIYKIPEAYEWVRLVKKNTNSFQNDSYAERVLPGVNLSLAWAISSLKKASDRLISLLDFDKILMARHY